LAVGQDLPDGRGHRSRPGDLERDWGRIRIGYESDAQAIHEIDPKSSTARLAPRVANETDRGADTKARLNDLSVCLEVAAPEHKVE